MSFIKPAMGNSGFSAEKMTYNGLPIIHKTYMKIVWNTEQFENMDLTPELFDFFSYIPEYYDCRESAKAKVNFGSNPGRFTVFHLTQDKQYPEVWFTVSPRLFKFFNQCLDQTRINHLKASFQSAEKSSSATNSNVGSTHSEAPSNQSVEGVSSMV